MRIVFRLEDLNIRIGRISHYLTPGYSWCHHCKTTWPFVRNHSTKYSTSGGCFPLCEKCWKSLTIDERMPYYRELWEQWVASDAARGGDRSGNLWEKWPMIEEAVKNGG